MTVFGNTDLCESSLNEDLTCARSPNRSRRVAAELILMDRGLTGGGFDSFDAGP